MQVPVETVEAAWAQNRSPTYACRPRPVLRWCRLAQPSRVENVVRSVIVIVRDRTPPPPLLFVDTDMTTTQTTCLAHPSFNILIQYVGSTKHEITSASTYSYVKERDYDYYCTTGGLLQVLDVNGEQICENFCFPGRVRTYSIAVN